MKRKTLVLFVLFLFSICYSQHIQIPIHYENSPTRVELYNVKGQRILSREFTKYNNAPFVLSNNLANQIYIMRVQNGSRQFTRKFMPNTRIQFTGNFANNMTRQAENTNDTDNFIKNSQLQNQHNATRTEEIHDPALDSITRIIFVNGIMNTREQAENSLRFIRNAYYNTLNSPSFPGGLYEFELAYNETLKEKLGDIGYLYDMAEATYMIYREAGISESIIDEILMPWLTAMMPTSVYVEMLEEDYSKALADSLKIEMERERPTGFFENFSNALNSLKERVGELIITNIYSAMEYFSFISKALMLASEPIINPIVEKNIRETHDALKKIIDESLDKKERVIVIAHSQGNLYMNALINDLNREKLKHTAVLNIATPSARTSVDDGWYWTNSNDEAINSARALLNSDILPGKENYQLSYLGSLRDNLNHKFYESHFNDAWVSRREIDKEIFNQSVNLSFWEVEEKKEEDGPMVWAEINVPKRMWWDIVYGDGVFLAVSTDGATMRSRDGGITWTEGSLPFGLLWVGIAYSDGIFIATSIFTDRIARSTDGGRTWSEVSNLPEIQDWNSIAYGDGVFVAKSSSTVVRSTNGGITWSEEVRLPISTGWNNLVYGNGVFLIATANRAVRSTDGGRTWMEIVLPAGIWSTVAYGDGVFIITTLNENKIVRSTDGGVTWTEVNLPFNHASICAYGGGRFILGNGSMYLHSTDGGITWTNESTPSNSYPGKVVYGDGVFIGIGNKDFEEGSVFLRSAIRR